MDVVDLDHNATTRPLPEVIEAVARVMRDAPANPGSRHAPGRRARRELEQARESVADILGARPEEVVFTSGGTEASNMALLGATRGSPGTILTTAGEHPATAEAVEHLANAGWTTRVLPVDRDGRVDWAALQQVAWTDVRLATLILANNETGVVQDTSPLAAACREHRVPLHLDAVQAVGKIPVDFHALGASTASVGAHKFHGPRGIGALLVRDGVRLSPVGFGGHQEAGRRPGTECVALAVGMAVALKAWSDDRERRTRLVRSLRDRFETGLAERCGPVVFNGSREFRLPNTAHVAFPGADAEAVLVALDLAGVCCSLGSTCSSGAARSSPVLAAMGVPAEIAASSLRFSLGMENTESHVDEAVRRIAEVLDRLRPRDRESVREKEFTP